jgi:TRAP-type C4-dicarboxylate transport system permease small subunit
VQLYFLAVLLLSGGAFIHSQSRLPALRPADPRADSAWRWLAYAALAAWPAMLAWGAWQLHWSQPLSALLGSLGVNGFLAWRGPRPAWPGLSMLMCGLGLLLAALIVLG